MSRRSHSASSSLRSSPSSSYFSHRALVEAVKLLHVIIELVGDGDELLVGDGQLAALFVGVGFLAAAEGGGAFGFVVAVVAGGVLEGGGGCSGGGGGGGCGSITVLFHRGLSLSLSLALV